MAELLKAIEAEDVVKVKELLANPNMNYVDEFGISYFFKACEKGNLEIVQAFLDDDRVN